MDYRWIEEIEDFKRISQEWDTAVSVGDSQPFLLSDFIITWWKYFEKGRKLRIFVLTEGGRIAGGIPLYLKRGGAREGFANLLRYIGDSAANYTEPLYAMKGMKLLPDLVRALSSRSDWDVLYLTDIREDNRFLTELNERVEDKELAITVTSDHMNFAIDLSGGLDKYLSSISPKLKRDIKVKRKHISGKFGEITLQKASGEDEAARCADIYKRFSLDAFSARKKKSSFENGRYSQFFRDFLIVMEKYGRLDAHLLKAGEEVLAVSFAYRFGKGFNWVLTAFNYENKYYRPGYILIDELLKEISRRKETYYNWYGYGRFYKDQWCNLLSPLYKAVIVRKALRGASYAASQRIIKALRSIRGMLGSAR